MVAYDILCFRIKSLKSWVRILFCAKTFAPESVHTHDLVVLSRGGTWSGQNKRSHRDGHRHIMWEELVGPTLLTCDNVEVSTTEALKDKKYVM